MRHSRHWALPSSDPRNAVAQPAVRGRRGRFAPVSLRALLVMCTAFAGCGTTKWTDTGRTATEQLLISDSMDRAVSQLDLSALAGKTVFLDDQPMRKVTDSEYLSSALRQHMLASGCILKEKRDDADYVVEVRAGAVGTDRHDVMYGIPAVDIPAVLPVSGIGVPTKTPEFPLVKKTSQRAVTKIAVFAYNRKTGRPVWQSGAIPMESEARAVWVFGAGPFQRGTIYRGTELAGDKISIPLINFFDEAGTANQHVSVADEAFFVEPERYLAQDKPSEAGPSGSGKAAAQHPSAEPAARLAERSEQKPSTGQPDSSSVAPSAEQAAPGRPSQATAPSANGTPQPSPAPQPPTDATSPTPGDGSSAPPDAQPSPTAALPPGAAEPSPTAPRRFERLPPVLAVPVPSLPFPDSLPGNLPLSPTLPTAPQSTGTWPSYDPFAVPGLNDPVR